MVKRLWSKDGSLISAQNVYKESLMNDTSENIDEIYRKMLMKIPGEKRILMGFSIQNLLN